MDKFIDSDEDLFILTDKYLLLDDIISLSENGRAELDLGCGRGDFSIALASAYPESTVFAADIMLGRLRKVQRKAHRMKLDNLKFLRVEARHLLTIIFPDASLDRVHILCPDPWPKNKHRGHRLLSSDFMAQIARVLKKDGIFHFATDDAPYLEAAIANVEGSGLFDRAADDALADVSGEKFKTEFERQWLAEGKSVTHIAWRKR